MKIRNTFLLAVLLLFVNEIQAKGASLNSLIEELAPIARLTNGIAIETELSADANKMNDVVAEFLRVGSRDDVAKLKELRVDEVAKELGELYATVEKVPELNVDMAALADTFKALETMKQSSDVLSRKLTDPSAEFKTDLAKSPNSHQFNNLADLEKTVEELKFIKAESNPGGVKGLTTVHLVPLKSLLRGIQAALIFLPNFETGFESLIRLGTMNEKLRDFRDMASISKHFTDNFDAFSTMGVKLNELKTGADKLKTVVDKQKSLPNIPKVLSESSTVVKRLLSEPPVLRMTVGFSGGVDDLKLMFEDLKNGKMKKLVSQGKETEGLQKSLSSLVSIHNKLESTIKTWSQMKLANGTGESEELSGILATMFENGFKTPETTILAQSLDSIAKCFKDLNLPASVPDFEEVTTLNSFAENLESQIDAMKKFLKDQKTVFEALAPKLDPLLNFVSPVAEDSEGDVSGAAWHGIRNHSELDSIIFSMSNIHGEFKKIKDRNPFKTLGEKIDLTVIPTVLDSLNGTNVDEMLACLQKTSYKSDELDSILNFGQSVKLMKSKKNEVESVKSLMTDLAQVKTGLVEVQKLTPSAQKLKSRRRRAPNQNSLANLKNAPTVAADLGKGVQVLREFAKILENEASVQVAVNADDGLKNAISAIPGVQSVWTDENRKGMGKMVVDLKELDKFAGRMSVESIKAFGKIFEEAGRVRGVEIDAKLFDDPISKALFSNFDWNIYPYHQTFHSLKDLQLNFTQHHEHLKAASLTLDPLQKFFDDLFEIKRSVKEEEGLSTVTLVIIICGSSVGVILLVLLVKFLVGRWQERRD